MDPRVYPGGHNSLLRRLRGNGKKDDGYVNKLSGALTKADTIATDSKFRAIRTALNAYYADNNEYPDTLDVLVPTYIGTQTDLQDAWGTTFKIETDDQMNLVLISAGKDKTFGNEDDIRKGL